MLKDLSALNKQFQASRPIFKQVFSLPSLLLLLTPL